MKMGKKLESEYLLLFFYLHLILPSPTIIGPFKFHESLIRYMQDIGWLYAPQFKWVLDIKE